MQNALVNVSNDRLELELWSSSVDRSVARSLGRRSIARWLGLLADLQRGSPSPPLVQKCFVGIRYKIDKSHVHLPSGHGPKVNIYNGDICRSIWLQKGQSSTPHGSADKESNRTRASGRYNVYFMERIRAFPHAACLVEKDRAFVNQNTIRRRTTYRDATLNLPHL